MYGILIHENKQMFKSIKALFVIAIFIITSYSIGSFVSNNLGTLDGEEGEYVSGLRFLVVFLGFFFVLLLNHDIVSKETSTQTIRLLITKISKTKIIASKFLALLFFWVFCLSVSLIVISIIAQEWYWFPFIELFALLFYANSVCVLISVVSRTTNFSMLLSLFFSVAIPIFGLWGVFSNN